MTTDTLQHLARDTLAAAFFGAVRDWHEHAAGHRMMVDAILAGDNIEQTLLLAAAADEQRDGTDQRAGAMAGLLDCLDALAAGDKTLHARGCTFGLASAALKATGERRRALLRLTPPERGAEMLSLLVQAGRAVGPYLKRAEPAAATPPPPPAPTPVQVHVALQMPAGPLPVNIVGQPATRSVQTVERDADQEIVQTVTTTTPVPAATTP